MPAMDLTIYKTWLIDCDGVILNSNKIKTKAFYKVAIRYGIEAAEKLVKYHMQNGGVSRYEKLRYFVHDILKKPMCDDEVKHLVEHYSDICKRELLDCGETPGLRTCLNVMAKYASLYLVSGGREDELVEVFRAKGLSRYFKGIYGSPQSKLDIAINLRNNNKLDRPIIFIGDSKYDYEVASSVSADFIFMTEFSEFKEWPEYFSNKSGCIVIKNLSDLYICFNQTSVS